MNKQITLLAALLLAPQLLFTQQLGNGQIMMRGGGGGGGGNYYPTPTNTSNSSNFTQFNAIYSTLNTINSHQIFIDQLNRDREARLQLARCERVTKFFKDREIEEAQERAMKDFPKGNFGAITVNEDGTLTTQPHPSQLYNNNNNNNIDTSHLGGVVLMSAVTQRPPTPPTDRETDLREWATKRAEGLPAHSHEAQTRDRLNSMSVDEYFAQTKAESIEHEKKSRIFQAEQMEKRIKENHDRNERIQREVAQRNADRLCVIL